MKRTIVSVLTLAAAFGLVWIALTTFSPGSWIARWAPCPRNWGWAPAWLPRRSALAAVPIDLDHGRAKLCYGRPSLRGRRMIGGEAVPYGRLWRTGANEPTTLHVDVPVRIGPLDLLPGSYSIYTVPDLLTWTVVLNRSTRQWGLESEYTDEIARQEVGRFVVPAGVLDQPVETLEASAVPAATGAVDLLFAWQTTQIRIPMEVVYAPD